MTRDPDQPEVPGDPDDDGLPPRPLDDDPLAQLEQQRYLRRILVAFFVVVVLLPLVGLGGTLGAVLLLPALVAAGFAARDAYRLRRSVRRHGDARGR